MFRNRSSLTIFLVILNLLCFGAPVFSQEDFSLSLGSGVVADPGQHEVRMPFILTNPDSVAGIDMLVQFDPSILTVSSVGFVTRFQYASYDNKATGKVKIVTRRHHPDSSYLAPLSPGTDTLGFMWLTVTSQDLLMDAQTPLGFFDDPGTPFYDNRLARSDSSLITPPELRLTDGNVFIRYPLYGDINDDGYVHTIADAIYFFNYLSGSLTFSSRQRANSDVNKDGVQASMTDFIELIRVITEE
jgi:hypothetical protein